MKVFSEKYGEGIILNQTENRVDVDFNGVKKNLIIKFAKLKKEDGTDFGEHYVMKESKEETFITQQEFVEECNNRGYTLNIHQALSGSKYVTVNGRQYRISDHFQPSHYQSRNYIDVFCFENILSIESKK